MHITDADAPHDGPCFAKTFARAFQVSLLEEVLAQLSE